MLCRRLKGFGLRHRLREQTAALRALAAIGGAPAAETVSRIVADAVVQGPGLGDALAAAARPGYRLPTALLPDWLRHTDPAIRVAACQCLRPRQGVEALLIDLLGDLNAPVAQAAACALGRPEARPALLRLLHVAPSTDAIAAIVPIADADSLVLLARLGRARPELLAAVLDALDAIDHPRAALAAGALRRYTARCD